MTTNVFDKNANILATDSRWSYTVKEGNTLIAVVYADDTGFDKMEIANGVCATFAGNSKLIDDWKRWIRSNNKVVLLRPRIEVGFAMCLVDQNTGHLYFEHGQQISDDKYRFAGTGAYSAYKCWTANKDALKSVSSASVDDWFSGGEVKYLDIQKQEHNVDASGLYDSINSSITERGIVMYVTYEGKPVPIQDAAATDPRIRNLVTRISSGEASAEAPSGLDPIVWTETDVKRLDTALEECFGPIAK